MGQYSQLQCKIMYAWHCMCAIVIMIHTNHIIIVHIICTFNLLSDIIWYTHWTQGIESNVRCVNTQGIHRTI